MSAIPAASVSPVVTATRASDAQATAPEESGQPFGGVLAREISRQNSEKSTQDDVAASTESVADDAAMTTSTADQQAAASPWLLMLQQLGQSLPVSLPQTLPSSQSSIEDESEPGAGHSDVLLQWVQQSITTIPVADTPVDAGKLSEQLVLAGQPGASAIVVAQNLPQLAANVSTDIGKELPQGLDIAGTQSDFAETLSDSLAQVSDVRAQPLLQPAPMVVEKNTVAASSEISSHAIPESVGDVRWGDAVAQRVSLMLGRKEQQMEMQLNPPNLGPMEVRLTLGRDQASVVFASQHAAVREALAAATPRLTALLADQGIQLVNVQVASDSLQQQAQDQSRNQAALRDSHQGARAESGQALDSPVALRELVGLGVPVARSGVSLFV